MGLPLFVAPVASDLPSQQADKTAALLHTRSSIRRSRRPDEREARSLRRRYAAARDSFRDNYPTPGPGAISDQPAQAPRYPWIESGHPPPMDAYESYEPPEVTRVRTHHRRVAAREALREVVGRGHSSVSDERLASLFGDDLARVRAMASPSPPLAPESRPAPRRSRFSAESSLIPYDEQIAELSASLRRGQPGTRNPVAARFDRSPEGRSRPARTSGFAPAVLREPGQRYRVDAPISQADGLGDRNRSLSPEGDGVWDTLLSTLTPDPQPPSVGSSFASAPASISAAATQGAEASSSTSLSGRATVDATGADQACESGCENSDTEDPDQQPAGTWLDHWSMNYPSRHRRFVTELSNDVARISFMRTEARRARQAMEGLRNARDSVRPMHGTRLRRGDSDDARIAGQGEGDVDLTPTSLSQSAHDESWEDMQLIVRGLARREDIPDEWWAGAGLSRTLPEDS